MRSPVTEEHRRTPVNLTLERMWRERAARMAKARGLSLSVYVEQLIRTAFAAEREAKKS